MKDIYCLKDIYTNTVDKSVQETFNFYFYACNFDIINS